MFLYIENERSRSAEVIDAYIFHINNIQITDHTYICEGI